ncbi:MAG: FitA-like ribbon-helix-helix domain-containing protein [Acidimicrobiia bacterium]
MRQLIARIDDDLHERLKARAAAEGRSLNSLVAEVLAVAAAGHDRSSVRARLERRGKRVVPDPPRRVPSRVAALRATRGAGAAVSTALDADRDHR